MVVSAWGVWWFPCPVVGGVCGSVCWLASVSAGGGLLVVWRWVCAGGGLLWVSGGWGSLAWRYGWVSGALAAGVVVCGAGCVGLGGRVILSLLRRADLDTGCMFSLVLFIFSATTVCGSLKQRCTQNPVGCECNFDVSCHCCGCL